MPVANSARRLITTQKEINMSQQTLEEKYTEVVKAHGEVSEQLVNLQKDSRDAIDAIVEIFPDRSLPQREAIQAVKKRFNIPVEGV